jgi:hypothetical protein
MNGVYGSSFGRRWVGGMIAALTCGAALAACVEDEGPSLGEVDPDYYIRRVFITPGYLMAAVQYWEVNNGERTRRVDRSDIPQGAEVVTVTTTVAASPSPSSDIFAPQMVPTTDTTIIAVFAGGYGPGNALHSSRLAVGNAVDGLITGFNMTVPRLSHAMTALQDGRVLITGGSGPAGTHDTAEIFSPQTNSISTTGAMRRPRAGHAAALLDDGRVLLTGGLQAVNGFEVNGPTELYEPATGTFVDGPTMSVARTHHSAVPLPDGRVLVLGGFGLSTAEVYSVATNSFTTVGAMSVVRAYGHHAVLLRSGKVLVTGGDTGGINPTASAELFDPATNSFTSAGHMTTPRMAHFAVLLDDGRVYIGGGRGPGGFALASTEIYDPATNTFTPDEELPTATFDAPAALVKQRAPN